MVDNIENIVFRCDASDEIGGGHVMRCLSLAESLSESGAKIYFVSRECEGNLFFRIQLAGHTLIPLAARDNKFTENENILQEVEANDFIDCIKDICVADWLIVDNYSLDSRWEKAVKKYTRKIFVIDDLANRKHDCELLLDQSFGRKEKEYSKYVRKDTKVLCGSKYSLLRKEFNLYRDKSIERRRKLSRTFEILISMGMSNNKSTLRILHDLQECSLPEKTKLNVVLGSKDETVKGIESSLRKMKWDSEIFENVDNVAEIMCRSDMAIGASGSTTWERCCLGLPSIVVVLAENQRFIAETLEKYNAVKILWQNGIESPELLCNKISEMNNDSVLSEMSKSCLNICDGLGVDRVISELRCIMMH